MTDKVKCPACKAMVDAAKPRCMAVAECNEARWRREQAATATYMWGWIEAYDDEMNRGKRAADAVEDVPDFILPDGTAF